MTVDEAMRLISRLSLFYPQSMGKDDDRKYEFAKKIMQFEYKRAERGIETCIETCTRYQGPNIAEVLTSIRNTFSEEVAKTYCAHCNNTGWVEGPNITRGTVVYETVKDCVCTTRTPESKAAGYAGAPEGTPGWIENLRGNPDREERIRPKPLWEDAEIF